MFGFTRQEKLFITFLVVSFVVGFGIKLFRAATEKEPNQAWKNKYNQLNKEFEKKSHVDKIESPKQSLKLEKKDLIGKININKADQNQLQLLPRIGPALAKRIIEYRQKKGPFRTTQEIKNVKGIGDKTFLKLVSRIIVE